MLITLTFERALFFAMYYISVRYNIIKLRISENVVFCINCSSQQVS
jgi:hypothetical protein